MNRWLFVFLRKIAEGYGAYIVAAHKAFVIARTALSIAAAHARGCFAKIDADRLVWAVVGFAARDGAIATRRARIANACFNARTIAIRTARVSNFWSTRHIETEVRYNKNEFPAMTKHSSSCPILEPWGRVPAMRDLVLGQSLYLKICESREYAITF